MYLLTGLAGQAGDQLIGKAELLRRQIQLRRQLLRLLEDMLHFGDALESLEEPLVDQCDLVDLIHRHDAAAQCLADGEDALVVALLDLVDDLLIAQLGDERHGQRIDLHLDRTDCLHHGALEAVGDGHDLAGCLHLRAERFVRIDELVKRPARELDDNVVQRRLKAGYRLSGDRIGQLVQTVADSDLCRDLRDRIAGRLGCQRRGARYTRVYLDDGIFKRVRIECELYIAAALDAQLGDDLERRGAEHLIFVVAQRLRRRNDDRIAGVNADRIDVLHIADGDDVALSVAHDLVLDFLPACDALLDQNLIDAGVHDAARRDLAQLLPGVCDAAAGAAQCVCWTNDDRQTDLLGELNRVLYRVDNLGGDDRLVDLLHRVLEQLTILRLVDRGRIGAEQFDAVLLEESLGDQLHRDVQAGLSAQCREDGVRALLFDDLLDTRNRHRLDVDLVGHRLVRHDSCRVGVHQNNLESLFPQCTACLRSCVVKLRRLSDDDRAGAEYHNFVNIFAKRHYCAPPFFSSIRSIN